MSAPQTNRARLSNQWLQEARAIVAAKHASDQQAAAARVREARQAEVNRVRLTAADLTGATHVRDRWGWWEVVRVNRTSVTVRGEHSWDERIPVGRILEARAEGPCESA